MNPNTVHVSACWSGYVDAAVPPNAAPADEQAVSSAPQPTAQPAHGKFDPAALHAMIAEDKTAGAMQLGSFLTEFSLGRAWLVFAPRIGLGSDLAVAADEAVILGATRVDAP
mgnify:CR=1 FL=1